MNNLTDVLPLERPLIIFDCETTGPDPTKDRIVELGFIQFKPDGSVVQWEGYVDPTILIPQEASHGNGKDYPGHGITNEMVKGKPTFAEIAPQLQRGFTPGTDYGGYNIKSFDLPLLQSEFERVGISWSYLDARIIDVFQIWRVKQKRTLSDAAEEFLHRSHEGAHRALADVTTTRDILIAQLERWQNLPHNVQALHEALWPVDPNAIDPDGKILWVGKVPTMNFGKKWKGKDLRAMTSRDLMWIANEATGMSKAVRDICRDAAAGKFPQPKATA